ILTTIWEQYLRLVVTAKLEPKDVAAGNLTKINDRWPRDRTWHPLLDGECPIEEQLPRALALEFRERQVRDRREVILRYQGVNIGDRLTDNIADPDGYRYHDIFHIAHAVFLGWSPIVRSLLRCKRKSIPRLDE